MTPNQSPPARPDEDALRKKLVAFSDFLNEPPQYEEQRMVRDYRHEAYAKWLPLVTELIARFATSPARDAAEGAKVDACPICGINRNSPFPCEHLPSEPVSDESALKLAHQICTGELSAVQGAVEIMQYATDGVSQLEREGYFAPPKPAPDAVREALQWISDQSNCDAGAVRVADLCLVAKNALVAAVPPADGALRIAFYSILTKYYPKDATMDVLWQELREAGVVP